MKIRLDFVTNSSSNSYVCRICGEIESGWDCGLDDFNMVGCINGHTFHRYCLSEAQQEEIEKLEEEDEDIVYYEIPEELCPICSFDYLENGSIAKYLMKTHGITKEQLKKELREKFSSYKELLNYLQEEG